VLANRLSRDGDEFPIVAHGIRMILLVAAALVSGTSIVYGLVQLLR
jgi:hypothetical protein